MPRLSRHSNAWLLLALLALPIVATVLLQGTGTLLSLTAEWRMEKQAAETIHIGKQQLHWVKEGKEILVAGQLFDVKRIVEKDDKLIISGVFDRQETEIKNILAHQSHQQDEQLTSILLFLIFVGLLPAIACSWEMAMKPTVHTNFKIALPGIALATDTPPPQV